jgi:hypothetical protein
MKPLLIIPVTVAATVGAVALVLRATGIRFTGTDPIVAGGIAAVAGVVAFLPILRLRQKDAVTVVQTALICSVLHFLCTAILSGAVIAAHLANFRGSFVFWLLGAFWVSLAIFIWQLRRVMLEMTTQIKAQLT